MTPRGLPDSYNEVKIGDLFRLDDMAELAARLGSRVVYHRFGDVFYIDDFEHGLNKWTAAPSAFGGLVELSQDVAVAGSLSCMLTSGIDPAPTSAIIKHLAPPLPGVAGFSIAFTVPADLSFIDFFVVWRDGAVAWEFAVRYDHTSGQLSWYSAVDTWTPFTTITKLRQTNQQFHVMKLSVNQVTHKYQRLYINQQAFTLTAHTAIFTGGPTSQELMVAVMVQGDGASTPVVYVDTAIVTQNDY